MAGGSDHARFVTPQSRRWWLFGRFDEPIAPEFYRWVGKLRVIILTVMLVMNFVAGTDPESAGLKPDVYWWGMLINTPIVLVSVALGVLMWRGSHSKQALRRMNIACLVVESLSSLFLLWGHGITDSHFLAVCLFLVFLYRMCFDFQTGMVALLILLIGPWLLFLAQLAGWIPPQPLLIDGGPPAYPNRDLGYLSVVSILMATSFLAADWTIARLRQKELAVRLLRETLAASDAGKVGRHTGRALKETYVVGPLLSAGGMGEVYRGHHRRTKRKVAIKILHPHLMDDEILLKRFRREAEVTGQLGSRNIVEVIDVDRDGDLAFLVLELLHGQDLAAHIESRGGLAVDEVRDIIGQAAEGLAVAHAAGVVHRDLKPENLFLCEERGEPVVKILDFGVSKIHGGATAITQEVALLGTPDFMAPEQARGQVTDIDARTDVFALGCITYNALTGQRPFRATSVPALLRRICDEEPPPLSRWGVDVPEDVSAVLSIAMAKRMDERYQGVAEFARDLEAALDGALADEVKGRAARVHRGAPATTSSLGDRAISHDDTVAVGVGTEDTLARG